MKLLITLLITTVGLYAHSNAVNSKSNADCAAQAKMRLTDSTVVSTKNTSTAKAPLRQGVNKR